ncbi:MAG: hypothetical protein ACO3LE_08445, partial [Bdellovibrionota bacterium]
DRILPMQATIAPNKITVRHTIREDVGREFLTFSIENGWDDVKKFVNKVLIFESKEYFFSAWNSDRNEVYFARQLTKDDVVLNPHNICWSSATIKNK